MAKRKGKGAKGARLGMKLSKIGIPPTKKISYKRIETLVHGYRRPTRKVKLKYKPMAKNILEATEP